MERMRHAASGLGKYEVVFLLVEARATLAAEGLAMRMRWVLGLGSVSLLRLLIIAGAVIERDTRSRERARQVWIQSENVWSA